MTDSLSLLGPPVHVIDLDTGNVGSVLKMLYRIGARPKVCASPNDIDGLNPIVIPGVGHFSKAARSLNTGQWRGLLNELHIAQRPILGICLGAQILCQCSEEGPGAGLGWIPTKVRRFPVADFEGTPLKVPHMSWQSFTPPNGCFPFEIPPGRMYYAQSYYIEPTYAPEYSPYQSYYGDIQYAAAVRSLNAIGVQFHPEKSHRYGMNFLRSWLKWACEFHA
jgi:glutamine amidotransferase